MRGALEYLRDFNFISASLRLLLALISGSIIGYGRARKQRSAGLRTYTLTCVGAALAILISLYENEMLTGAWAYVAEITDVKFDASRYAAQVITGVGFLAAGTIIAVAHRQVSGLTSAIGLFATACIGIAAGAGFYEVVLPATVLISVAMESMQPVEIQYKRALLNITIFVEFDNIDDLDTISSAILDEGAQIFDIDVENPGGDGQKASVIMTIKLTRGRSSHSSMLSTIAELSCVDSVRELIS